MLRAVQISALPIFVLRGVRRVVPQETAAAVPLLQRQAGGSVSDNPSRQPDNTGVRPVVA